MKRRIAEKIGRWGMRDGAKIWSEEREKGKREKGKREKGKGAAREIQKYRNTVLQPCLRQKPKLGSQG
jgi:hypothetical protein